MNDYVDAIDIDCQRAGIIVSIAEKLDAVKNKDAQAYLKRAANALLAKLEARAPQARSNVIDFPGPRRA